MNPNNQKFTGKKRNYPGDYSEEECGKAEDRSKYAENFDRRNYQNQSQTYYQNSRRNDNKDQKMILNNNNFYKKSNFPLNSNSRNDDNYSVSPSRSPSIKESQNNNNSPNHSDNNVNYRDKRPHKNENRNYQSNYPGQNENYRKYNENKNLKDFRDNRNYRDRNRDYNQNQNRNTNKYDDNNNLNRNDYRAGSGYNKEMNRGDDNYYDRNINRYADFNPNNSNFPKHNQGRSQSNISNENYNEYNKHNRDNDNRKFQQNKNNVRSHDDRERYNNRKYNKDNNFNKTKLNSDSESQSNYHNRNRDEDKNSSRERRHNKKSRSYSRSNSKSSHNSLSKSRFDSNSRDKENDRSRSKDKKKYEQRGSFDLKNRDNNKKNESSVILDNKNPAGDVKMKRFNFLMCLPKNYYRFIEQDYGNLFRDIKKKIRELKHLQYTYLVKGFHDNVLRIDANRVSSNAEVLKMVCEHVFKEMKIKYPTMTYLKISILVPSHVVGFIIGIEGKNINKIRDTSGAKIDVFHENINNRYRQIELAGSVSSLSSAAEQMYRFVNKYYYYNPNQAENEEKGENKRKDSNDQRRNRSPKNEEYNQYNKKTKDGVVLGGERKRLKVRRHNNENNKEKEDKERKKDNSKYSSFPVSRSISRSKSPKDFSRDLDLNENNNLIISENKIDNNLPLENYPEANQNNIQLNQTNDISNINKAEILSKNERQIIFYTENSDNNNSNIQKSLKSVNFNTNNYTEPASNLVFSNVDKNLNHSDDNQIKITQGNPDINMSNNIINKSNSINDINVTSNDISKLKEEIIDNNNNIQIKLEGNKDNYNYFAENPNFRHSNENKGKISIDMIVPTKTINLLKNFQNNIYIEMENKYGCQITKRVEKLANNEELNILTFYGEPEQNSYALFYLMRHISDIENN